MNDLHQYKLVPPFDKVKQNQLFILTVRKTPSLQGGDVSTYLIFLIYTAIFCKK